MQQRFVIGWLFLGSLVGTSAAPNAAAARIWASAGDEDLEPLRALLAEARGAKAAQDYVTARARIVEAIERALTVAGQREDAPAVALLAELGSFARDVGEPRAAARAQRRVLEVLSRSLSGDHADLQKAKEELAVTQYSLGDLAGARVLLDEVLEVRARTLPGDHPDLQATRENLAVMRRMLGDLRGASALGEQVLEVYTRTLPDDHPDLQRARNGLAVTIKQLGDIERAHALEAKVLEVLSRTLPDDHPDLQRARANLALTIRELGDLEGARVLEEKVLAIRTRTLPDDDARLQNSRLGLALTLKALGDFAGARALEEQALAVYSRTHPDDYPDLQLARGNLAQTLRELGDLAGARSLDEKVLAVYSRTRPDEHPDLQIARGNLAATLCMLREFQPARPLQEKVLAVYSRTLRDDHALLQIARNNLATTMLSLGDFAGARSLFEKVLEVRARTHPDEHPDVQGARSNLAVTIGLELARALRSTSTEVERAPDAAEDRARCAEILGALARAQARAARAVILASPSREAEERCSSLAQHLGMCVSFAQGYGVFEPLAALRADSFSFSEVTRGSALASAALARKAITAPEYGELRESLNRAGDELARLAQRGTTSAEFDRARVQREKVERDLVRLARDLSGGEAIGIEVTAESLAAVLAVDQAAVGFRRLKKPVPSFSAELDSMGRPLVLNISVESLCAFVVRSAKSLEHESAPTSPLVLVDLGPIAPIEKCVRAWRAGLGASSDSRGMAAARVDEAIDAVSSEGDALRARIFDPLLPALAGARRIVVALDDVLHVVPLDALPLGETAGDGARVNDLIGDRWRIETRATLSELLQTPEVLEGSGALVAFGDVDYSTEGSVTSEATPAAQAGAPAHAGAPELAVAKVTTASLLRAGAWAQGFASLPGTGVEVRGVARSFSDRFGAEAAMELCESTSASRARLIELAPKARFLHIATHGWFAPESIKSWSDPEPLDKQSGLAMRVSGEEQVKGMSPMLLCGLALAGANLPGTASGRAPGLVTADELSTLDLSNCDLVVLSACDTNVGERRAGQGVASLQKALQMAGARSVITSLWKVPDEATKELMLDFYRRLWVEKKPKHQALWEAKTKLREARDERGASKYTTRDWAAWVLTGNPE